MGLFFDAKDIFEIAIEIERNGAVFYRNAAAVMSDEVTKRELLELAAMEDQHEHTFAALMARVVGNAPDAEWFNADSDAAQYLQHFASGQIFDMRAAVPPALAPNVSMRDVLAFAIQRERESVVFYTGLKDAVPDAADKLRIETIIREEMGHITLLGRKLAVFAQKA
ncbi:MAG TPA: ferritin family protein [Candidatus Hydrogenedentes bacterium]|nr:ferritin family protein [Candidatus Hydrogenedentota bacterium]HRT19772.1 ferritin family protein [Candidatus Hydrogenedentota bacterium]HRT64546.1 ferritin family protein [Candidatus Hydrogenedentota bacterium]